ncbi:tyrosine-type recombinase/integrase [Salinibacter altiplanensis]|uniref:tyrosine-type recombinase/integrase n=1 Tax=Salinibacter altiplanensis TaxID=1803181 RepID=UPI002342E4EA
MSFSSTRAGAHPPRRNRKVGRVSPYTLRHTFAIRLYRKTGNIRMVQKSLGHSDLSTTMIYTHVVDEELEGAMKEL